MYMYFICLSYLTIGLFFSVNFLKKQNDEDFLFFFPIVIFILLPFWPIFLIKIMIQTVKDFYINKGKNK